MGLGVDTHLEGPKLSLPQLGSKIVIEKRITGKYTLMNLDPTPSGDLSLTTPPPLGPSVPMFYLYSF